MGRDYLKHFGVDALIGRDLLRHAIFSYDGVAGITTLKVLSNSDPGDPANPLDRVDSTLVDDNSGGAASAKAAALSVLVALVVA